MRTLEQTAVIPDTDKALLAEVKRVIREFLPDATLWLYGSAARGARDAESDYDILVFTHEPIAREKYDAVEGAILEVELDREVVLSTIFRTWTQWETPISRGSPFHEEVDRDAVLL